MTDVLTIGLVGCGAVVHANYAQTLRGRRAYAVRYVFDVVREQAESAARLFDAEILPVTELVERAGAVIVTTPPDTHAGLVSQCVRPGNVVLCEKPFTTSYRDAVAAVKLAASIGGRLYVGHFRRTFPQVQLARSLVQLGAIGSLSDISVSEGGRFTWKAVSDYTVRDPHGGVLWDTGSHALDMAVFAAGLDHWRDCEVAVLEVERDKPEPSHDFRGRFRVSGGESAQQITGRLHVSRTEVLPNIVRLTGERGTLAFSVAMDRHVRLTTTGGSAVLTSEREHVDLMECVDLQMRRVLLAQGDDDFVARRFLALTKMLEALSHG